MAPFKNSTPWSFDQEWVVLAETGWWPNRLEPDDWS
jgi:hypothetical protein